MRSNVKNNKYMKIILIIVLEILSLIWAIPYIHNEILKKIYGNTLKSEMNTWFKPFYMNYVIRFI